MKGKKRYWKERKGKFEGRVWEGKEGLREEYGKERKLEYGKESKV